MPADSPIAALRLRPFATPEAKQLPARGFVTIRPDAEAWLADLGLTTAESFLRLAGEVVSGHADRHVLRVVIGSGMATRVSFLKREHRVRWRFRWRNWRAGFGGVSNSVREGRMLRELEAAGMPAPRWLAFGGDGNGRSFLLVEAVVGAVEWRRGREETSPPRPPSPRRGGGCPRFALPGETSEAPPKSGDIEGTPERSSLEHPPPRLGEGGRGDSVLRTLARLHEAGFDHPDLTAKHVLVQPETGAVTFLDWQRARRLPSVSWLRRIRSLAALNATIADRLASPRERLRALRAYLRTISPDQRPRFSELARAVIRETAVLLRRRSFREQRSPLPSGDAQRLVWLDGEALVAVPSVVCDLEDSALRRSLYSGTNAVTPFLLPGGRAARLRSRRTRWPFGHWWALLRGRSWRAPELRLARLLFHLERHSIPAPRLLAFGQRPQALGAESFLLDEPLRGSMPLAAWWAETAELRQRRRVLAEAGKLLRRLHDAGCCLRRPESVPVAVGREGGRLVVAVDDAAGLLLRRKIGARAVRAELRRLWKAWRECVSRTDALHFLRGYLGLSRLTPEARRLARRLA